MLRVQDPYRFRRALLAHRADCLHVIDTLAQKSDWGKPMQAGRGRGMAIHESYDFIVGMVAEVTVTGNELKIDRVVIAADTGHVVNPRTVEMQLEGGMIYGLSAAIWGEITIPQRRRGRGQFRQLSGRAPERRAEDRGAPRAHRRQEMGRHRRTGRRHHPGGGDQCDIRCDGEAVQEPADPGQSLSGAA